MEFLIDHALASGAALATVLGALAWMGDHRRMRRTNLDRVGLMPWQTLFVWATLFAVVLGAAALQTALSAR